MKKLFVRVMLNRIHHRYQCLRRLLRRWSGVDRSSLSREQIAARSARSRGEHELFTAPFSGGLGAPRRFQPRHQGLHESAAARTTSIRGPRGNDLHRELRRSAGEEPDRAGRHRPDDQGIREGMRLRTGKRAVSDRRPSRKRDGLARARTGGKVMQTIEQPITRRSTSVTSRARDLGDGATREQSPLVAGRQHRFRDRRIPHGRRPDGEAAVGIFGRTVRVSDVPHGMRSADLSYPELYWTNTPYFRPEVYEALDALNRVDYSPTYYFRVRQAMRSSRCTANRPTRTPSWRPAIRGASDGRCCRARSGALSRARCPRRRPPVSCIRMPTSASCCCRTSPRTSASVRREMRCRPSARRLAPLCSSRIT